MTVNQAISYLLLLKDKNEPVFVLRGQDILTPAAIQKWCEDAYTRGVSKKKRQGAQLCRTECLEWTPRKLPD